MGGQQAHGWTGKGTRGDTAQHLGMQPPGRRPRQKGKSVRRRDAQRVNSLSTERKVSGACHSAITPRSTMACGCAPCSSNGWTPDGIRTRAWWRSARLPWHLPPPPPDPRSRSSSSSTAAPPVPHRWPLAALQQGRGCAAGWAQAASASLRRPAGMRAAWRRGGAGRGCPLHFPLPLPGLRTCHDCIHGDDVVQHAAEDVVLVACRRYRRARGRAWSIVRGGMGCGARCTVCRCQPRPPPPLPPQAPPLAHP